MNAADAEECLAGIDHPNDWPRRAAQEKGIDVALAVDFVVMVANRACDVGILFSSDTDLVPALEAVLALRPQDPPACEVAAWAAPGGRPRSLSVREARLRRHLLTDGEYRSVADLTDVSRVLHVRGAVRIEVLALHVDDKQGDLPVLKVADHVSSRPDAHPDGT